MAKKPGVLRTTISIPTDLKRRMDKVSEDVNWSGLACRAFEDKLAELSAKKEKKNMSDVIERLRASKRRTDDDATVTGRADGEKWAKEKAEAAELQRLLKFVNGFHGQTFDFDSFLQDDSSSAWSSAEAILFAISPDDDGDRQAAENFWGCIVVSEGLESDTAYLRGFVDGALDVWEAVEKEL